MAILVGFENNRAVLWQVFSNVAKLHANINLAGEQTDAKARYVFHESVVDALRPFLKEGVRSVVLASPERTRYATEFLGHVQKHHAYMTQPGNPNAVAFGTLVGSTSKPQDVAELVKTERFRKLISETTSGEADVLMNTLEKRLNDMSNNVPVLFSLTEIEHLICNQWKPNDPRPEYLMLTDRYQVESREKNRLQRLLQISKNKNVKTRIVKANSPAGKRLTQLGGLVCFTKLGQVDRNQ